MKREKLVADRIAWVDMAKGIGMLAIVLGHVLRGEGFLSKAVYAFHVPLFFFLSGYLHRPDRKWDVRKRAYKLLLPYVLFGLISIGIYSVLGKFAGRVLGENQHYTPVENLGWLAYGYSFSNSPLWFLPCQFVMELVLGVFSRICEWARKKAQWVKTLAWSLPLLISGAVTWLYFTKLHVLWPWCIQSMFCLLPFAWIGYGFSRLKKPWNLPGWAKTTLGIGLLTAGLVLGTGVNSKIQYITLDLGIWPLFYCSAFLIVIGLCILLPGVRRLPVLEAVGRWTMPILLMHKFPVLFFQCLCPVIKDWLASGSATAAFLVTGVSAAMCIGVGAVLQRILPEVLGQRRKIEKKHKI